MFYWIVLSHTEMFKKTAEYSPHSAPVCHFIQPITAFRPNYSRLIYGPTNMRIGNDFQGKIKYKPPQNVNKTERNHEVP